MYHGQDKWCSINISSLKKKSMHTINCFMFIKRNVLISEGKFLFRLQLNYIFGEKNTEKLRQKSHPIGYKATILFTKYSNNVAFFLFILTQVGLLHLFQQLHFKLADIIYSYFSPQLPLSISSNLTCSGPLRLSPI